MVEVSTISEKGNESRSMRHAEKKAPVQRMFRRNATVELFVQIPTFDSIAESKVFPEDIHRYVFVQLL
jgi:hypothetical protein